MLNAIFWTIFKHCDFDETYFEFLDKILTFGTVCY